MDAASQVNVLYCKFAARKLGKVICQGWQITD